MIGTARHVLLSLVTSALALHLTAQSQQTAPTNPVIDAVTSQLRALAHLTVDGSGTYIPLFQTEGQEATASQHAFVRSSSACSRQSRCCSAAPRIWVPHVPTDAGVGPGGEQLRSEAGARTTPPFQYQDDPGHLCPSHYVGQAGSAGDVPDRTVEGFMGGEQTGNDLRCLAQNPRFVGILWADSNRGIPNNCFEMWWPGRELNPRRQPFQGCALPPELPGHFSFAHRCPQID